MGVIFKKRKLSELKIDYFLRIDSKFHIDFKDYEWDIFHTNSKELIPLKELLESHYVVFEYKNGKEYKGIPTGRDYIDEFGYITSYQPVNKEKHPGRLKYQVDNDCILLSSLKGAITPSLNFDFDLSNYVFSNGFYIFKAKNGNNKKFLLHLLRTKRIKYLIDNVIYRGIGIPAYREDDLLKLKIPKIPIEQQNEIVNKIIPIEQEIKQLKDSKKDILEIINEVFADYYNYSRELWKEFGKGMIAGTQKSYPKTLKMYKIAFSQIEKSKTLRFSSRFHNPITQKLTDILFSKPTIKLNKILLEKIHRGVTPKYDLNGNIPVVKTGHLKNEYIVISDEEFVSENFYNKKSNAQINRNDVLIASTGKVSLGKIDIVNTNTKLIADGHISIIRIDENKYIPLFLTYFLRSILGAFQVERDYTGATNQIELYADEIENFEIPEFSLKEQTEIVEKIKSKIDAQKEIDKKIEEKQNKINELIENSIML